jgi:hypothetical protein
VISLPVADIELPAPAADGRTYVSTRQAAAAVDVAPCTISRWKREQLLTPLPGSPPRQPMYDLEAVRDAERAARQKAIADGHGYWVQRRPGLRRSSKNQAT